MEQEVLTIYMKAALRLYGICHMQDLANMIQHYGHPQLVRKEMQRMAEECQQHDCTFTIVGAYLYEPTYFASFEQALQMYKKNVQKPFYYPPIDQLHLYADANYIEVQPCHRALARLLKDETNADEQQITACMRRILLMIKGESDMRSLMNEFLLLGTIPSSKLPVFSKLLEAVMNETRRFANHGFTPAELQLQYTKQR